MLAERGAHWGAVESLRMYEEEQLTEKGVKRYLSSSETAWGMTMENCRENHNLSLADIIPRNLPKYYQPVQYDNMKHPNNVIFKFGRKIKKRGSIHRKANKASPGVL